MKFGARKINGIHVTGITATLSENTVEAKNETGDAVGVIKYGEKVECTVSGEMLESTEMSAVESAVKSAASEIATSAPFNLDAGGSVVISGAKTTEANEAITTVEFTATYYPKVTEA